VTKSLTRRAAMSSPLPLREGVGGGVEFKGRRLIVALDTADTRQAAQWATDVGPYSGLIKLGLEFFAANGPAGIRALSNWPMFLDLKLHDIPNTVAGAVRALLPLGPRMLTLHAAGGGAMIAAARDACPDAPGRPLLLAVTVLTSLDEVELVAMGIHGSVQEHVLRLARMAIEHGADGVVCSPLEVHALRAALGERALLVVPGIRPRGAEAADQARVMTPEEAVAAGADFIVVGRPITGAPDRGAAAREIAEAIAR
jgi:orotidine-5'-phosphate decarboxylase